MAIQRVFDRPHNSPGASIDQYQLTDVDTTAQEVLLRFPGCAGFGSYLVRVLGDTPSAVAVRILESPLNLDLAVGDAVDTDLFPFVILDGSGETTYSGKMETLAGRSYLVEITGVATAQDIEVSLLVAK